MREIEEEPKRLKENQRDRRRTEGIEGELKRSKENERDRRENDKKTTSLCEEVV